MRPTPSLLAVGLAISAVSFLVLIRILWLGNRSLWGSVRCWLRGRHNPLRNWLGFRCSICGLTGAGLDEFGFPGYVDPVRRTYERDDRGSIRPSERET